jgi:hypothetical protein
MLGRSHDALAQDHEADLHRTQILFKDLAMAHDVILAGSGPVGLFLAACQRSSR